MVLLEEWHVAVEGRADLDGTAAAQLVARLEAALVRWAAEVERDLPVLVTIGR